MNPKFHRHQVFFAHSSYFKLHSDMRQVANLKKKKKNNHWVYLVEVLLWLLHQIDSGAYSSMA